MPRSESGYVERPPTDEALRDLVQRAANEHGSWLKSTPSGHDFDMVAAARELLEQRAELESLNKRLARLADVEEGRAACCVADETRLRERLNGLLNGVALGLRGPPPELTMWSFHDLPERAEAMRARVAELEAARERERGYERLVRSALDAKDESTLMAAERTAKNRERVAELEAEAMSRALDRNRLAYHAGAESMRERAAVAVDEQADAFGLVAEAADEPMARAASRAVRLLRSAAGAIRAIPLDDDAREEPEAADRTRQAGGDCSACGDLTGMPTKVYRTPEHNGVDAYPADTRLCDACAYELAEQLQEWAEKERAHARDCGAAVPGDGAGEDDGDLAGLDLASIGAEVRTLIDTSDAIVLDAREDAQGGE